MSDVVLRKSVADGNCAFCIGRSKKDIIICMQEYTFNDLKDIFT